MNLEETSKHPDRVACDAAGHAYKAVLQMAACLLEAHGVLDDRTKPHMLSAIEEACMAYRKAKSAENAIVNSGFFPVEIAEPETAEAQPAPDPVGQDVPEDPDETHTEENESFVRSYILSYGHVYKFPAEDRMALKFVDSVDFVRNRFGGEKNVWHVFGLETCRTGDNLKVYVLLSVEPSAIPGSMFFRKPLSEFSTAERASIIDMMKHGNAGLFSEDKIGGKPNPIPEPDGQDGPEEAFVRSFVLEHGYAYKMQSIERVAMKFVAPVDLPAHIWDDTPACSVVGLETSNDKDGGKDFPCVYALVLYADMPGFGCLHKPFEKFSVREQWQLVDMMRHGGAGRFDDEKIGADSTRKEDDPFMIEDESFARCYIRAQGSAYDTSIATQFSHPVVVFGRRPLGEEEAPAYSVVGLGVQKSEVGGVFAIVAKNGGYALLRFMAFPDDSQRKLINVMKQGNSGVFCDKIKEIL